jgi:hypothetical protein
MTDDVNWLRRPIMSVAFRLFASLAAAEVE